MPLEAIRVFVVDDHATVREGIRHVLGARMGGPKLVLCGEAATVGQALPGILAARPDVVLTDLTLPDAPGLDLLRALSRAYPEGRSLVFTMHLSPDFLLESLRAGARGYVVKESDSAVLVEAIDRVAAGEAYLDRKTLNLLCDHLAALPPALLKSADPRYLSLTDREREIFHRLILGDTTKEMAHRFQLSTKTVDNHRLAVFRKLELGSVADLQTFAREHGL